MKDQEQRPDGPAGVKLRQEPVVSGVPADEAHKFSTVPEPATEEPKGEIDQLGPLPRSYGSDTIFLVAQDPHWLFTYWDIDISKHPGGPTKLRYCDSAGNAEGEIEVPFETRNWYIPVQHAGASYYVDLGYYRGEAWHSLARSEAVCTPPDKVGDGQEFSFATVPLHISFQRLLDNVRSAMKEGESLMHALSRLQQESGLGSFMGSRLDSAQRAVLESLLGKDLVNELSSGAYSSEQIEKMVTEHLRKRLDSQSASELLAKGGVSSWFEQLGGLSSAEISSSSLFSALSALSSAQVSSMSSAAFSSWAAAAVSSWAAAAFSSFAAAAQSSWSQAAASSWSGAETSSWAQAALASWTQAALSSWSGAALSSWSQAAMSSWGPGASWSGQAPVEQPREFFMHVNAEVIFYGGTHPDARVQIAGEPVALQPDGTFHYHFKFPDGDYTIPIVATSPDGVETRSATLRFVRDTTRSGDVANTGQPAHLEAPINAGS